jgi:hypothetical protein
MQKVAGVDSVRVSLNDGLTILDLRPGNSVTIANLRQIIRNNGFVSREAEVVATGRARSLNGRPVFEVSGTGEQLTVASDPKPIGDEWRMTVKGKNNP